MRSSDFKVNIPEAKVYIAVVGILGLSLLYFDLYMGIGALVLLAYLVFHEYKTSQSRKMQWTEYIENLSLHLDKTARYTLLDFPLGICILDAAGILKWHNRSFADIIGDTEILEMHFNEVMKELSLEKIISTEGEEIHETMLQYAERQYKVRCHRMAEEDGERAYVLYFFDDTELEDLKRDYLMEKAVIINIQIDSFDEVLSSAPEDMRPLIEADVERTLKAWSNRHQGIYRKVSKDKIFIMVYEKELLKMEQEKFSILDEIRKIEHANTLPVTISIGAASAVEGLEAAQKSSLSCLDLALGRGGDQAVIRRNERSTFYGGKSKAVEKKTRVKARIIAHALRDLINESDNVLIMGHHYPDLDAIGAAVGLYGICQMLNKRANIVLDRPNTSIDVLYDRLSRNEAFRGVFLNKEESLREVGRNTLLIVCDTHRPSFTEYPKLIEVCEKIVLVDHHRRGEEFLDKAVLIYHETYASSASEMVTELIQYIKERPYIDALTAESLLSGISLDTKSFTFKTGVRTFEAAAFLRKFGADTIAVKQLFQGDLDSFLVRAESIKNAKILGGCIAMTACPENLVNPPLIAAQIADELLNIRGVKASFCLAKKSDGMVFISARSMGDINVHLLMEKLGGGGHIDVAGAQLTNSTTEEAIEKVEELVMEFLKEEINR